MMEFTDRNIKSKLIKALGTTPVVLLTGARQTGKTTLMKEVATAHRYSYVTFDDYTELALAKVDPAGYLTRLQKPVILDEIQRVPELFIPIKKMVDEKRISGNFAMTGSANPLLIPRLGDSLAGRIEILPLFPFSQGELRGCKETLIESLFAEDFDQKSHSSIDPLVFWNQFVLGGYPEMQSRKNDSERQIAWCKSYITMILERDVQDLSKIEGLSLLPNLLKLLAARPAGLLNIAELSRSIQLSASTIQRYIELLRATYLVHLLPAWFGNRSKRITKSPKIHLLDSGLLTFLLGQSPQGFLSQPHLNGLVLESFIVTEILKQSSWSAKMVQLFHFRSDPHEVDLVLEDMSGKIVGVEIKSTSSLQPDDFKGLYALKEQAGRRFHRGIVFYFGTRTISFGDDFFALPITALWERN